MINDDNLIECIFHMNLHTKTLIDGMTGEKMY